jgi:hypothetical protein
MNQKFVSMIACLSTNQFQIKIRNQPTWYKAQLREEMTKLLDDI